LPRLKQYIRDAGRDPDSFGLTARIIAGPGGPAAWLESAQKSRALGATHLTLGAPPDLQGPAALQRLIEARRTLADELGA
jgi:hypothetical protein